MNEASEERPLWLPPISLVVILLIVCLASFVSWPTTSPEMAGKIGEKTSSPIIPFNLTGQALLLYIVVRGFCYWPPMVRWITSMPLFHRGMFALLVGGMIVGHYTLDSRNFYPYVSWFIFPTVREDDPVTCREFIATTASGQKVRLLVEQLFPSIVQIYPLDDPKHYSDALIDELARTLTTAYNQHHPDNPVRNVDFVVMAVKLHPPASESRTEPSCQLLKRYDFSSDR